MLSARVRHCGSTRSGTEPYSTDDVPFNATPINGKTKSAASSGSWDSARIPAAVKPSVSHTVPIAPIRAPIKAQASLPAAPPAKIRVIAKPTVCKVAPFCVSTNGKNNKKAIRVALSITPLPVNKTNASGCRLPSSRSDRVAARADSRRGAANKIAAATAMPKLPKMNNAGRQGGHQQHQRKHRRHRHLSQIASEVVGADRLERTRSSERTGDERRGDRMLRAGANSAEKKRAEQRHKGGAQTRQAIADTGERRVKRQHDRRAESLGHVARGDLQRSHGADERAAEEPERRIGQAEFGLPQWQHDVDEVGITVVQRVRDARDRGGATLFARHLRREPCEFLQGKPGHDHDQGPKCPTQVRQQNMVPKRSP